MDHCYPTSASTTGWETMILFLRLKWVSTDFPALAPEGVQHLLIRNGLICSHLAAQKAQNAQGRAGDKCSDLR